MRLTKPAALLFLFLFGLGCAANRPSVYRISAVSTQFASGQLTAPASEPPSEASFEDQHLTATFTLHDAHFGMTLRNHGDRELHVLWDETEVTYPSGRKSRVLHAGVPLRNRDAPQAPTNVPPGGTLEDLLCPKDMIHYSAGPYGKGWWYGFIVPTGRGGESHAGLVYTISLALDIGGTKTEYLFPVRLEGVVPLADPPTKAADSKRKTDGNPPAKASAQKKAKAR